LIEKPKLSQKLASKLIADRTSHLNSEVVGYKKIFKKTYSENVLIASSFIIIPNLKHVDVVSRMKFITTQLNDEKIGEI
jgi:hypothetical protein